MLVTESRPRNLKWFHAGPLLYGDWGTSRLYVLGLAFFYTAGESVLYMIAISLLMAAVAWGYTIVCRSFPDGGGVYTAARQLSPVLSVIGATLLLCGYLITAAISVVEAMHYFGMNDGFLLVAFSVVIILVVGAVNWLGAKSAGTFALFIAIAALSISGLIALMSIPFLKDGFQNIQLTSSRGLWPHWTSFTQIVLALAGVEAVANMTGLMKRPVKRTAKRTILPVLIEVVALNLLFGIVMTGIFSSIPELSGISQPLSSVDLETLTDPNAVQAIEDIKNTAMEVIAHTVATNMLGTTLGAIFSKIAAVVFGLLLLSATNTAIMAMVSVLYAMAQDKELPRPLTKLNYSGVPWIALVASCVVSVLIIFIERRPEKLAELYIIGVCGAITVTVLSCSLNRELKMARIERLGMTALGVFLLTVSLTIVVTKANATLFAGLVIAMVLAMRLGLATYRKAGPPPVEEPRMGWLAQVKAAETQIDPSRPKIMLAARGRYQAEFAVDLAKSQSATLFVIFVRTLRVMDLTPGNVPQIRDDADAVQALGATALLAAEAGVPFVPIYVTSTDIAEEILDYTVTYGCNTLIMGKSRRSLFSRKIEGDVISRVVADLPDDVALITRSAQTPHVSRPAKEKPEDKPAGDAQEPSSEAQDSKNSVKRPTLTDDGPETNASKPEPDESE